MFIWGEAYLTGACPVECLPSEILKPFHRGVAYSSGADKTISGPFSSFGYRGPTPNRSLHQRHMRYARIQN
jgi:hypothetical protein